jgi:hypothetical protein
MKRTHRFLPWGEFRRAVMKKYVLVAAVFCVFTHLFSQTPLDRRTGIGIILGDPTGLTVKTVWSRQTDLTANIGSSYFGALRIGVDWTWNFDVFNDRFIHLYFGPGAVLGIGNADGIIYRSKSGYYFYRPAGEAGIGVRGIFGVCGRAKNEPFEFFAEFGPLIGLVPHVGSSIDAGIGIRCYP